MLYYSFHLPRSSLALIRPRCLPTANNPCRRYQLIRNRNHVANAVHLAAIMTSKIEMTWVCKKFQHTRKYCLVDHEVFLGLGTVVCLLLVELHSTVFHHHLRVRYFRSSPPITNKCWTDTVVSLVEGKIIPLWYLCALVMTTHQMHTIPRTHIHAVSTLRWWQQHIE